MKFLTSYLLLTFLLLGNVNGQDQESKFKALFILKFISNVSWPGEKKDLVIGVVGKSEVYTELEARLGVKNPNGITVKRISPAEAALCDVVFLTRHESSSLSVLSSILKVRSSLIISEADLSRKGSGISFIEEQGKLNFIINRTSIEASGLTVSASLLSLGKQS